MLRTILICVLLWPASAFAQDASGGSSPGTNHQAMDHARMHLQMMGGPNPTEPGQSAFAAIQEIVGILEADPATDWSKVNINALRNHLADMDAVTLHAQAAGEPVEGGIRFTVTGDEPVAGSIRRMVIAHAATMDGVNRWHYQAVELGNGATLTVTAPPSDLVKLNALGFFGILTIGMHHQQHHMMLARGLAPH
jgi:hypothetical protein